MVMMSFNNIYDSAQLEAQSKFVKLSNMVYHDPNTKLLDVGAGGIPLTSFLFTTDYTDVSSMDKFLISNDFLKAQNVTPYNQYYTNYTDVSNFDFVVGRRPCSAIPSIVKTCSKQNKPYLLELCGCHLEHMTLPDGSHPNSWQDILPLYDEQIQFAGNYAFNVDISQSQATRIIESLHPEAFTQKNGVPKNFVAMSFLVDCFNEIEQEMLASIEF